MTANPHQPTPGGANNQLAQELDSILSDFAKRVTRIPRGKTYGWDDERQALLAAIEAHTNKAVATAQLEARIDELYKIEEAAYVDDDYMSVAERIDNLEAELAALQAARPGAKDA